ncbi:AsmA family protein [Enterovibrio sp. 27052020O]|uniref:AsmA family protein n=1 Tax=Enterovibrio sp. 27052020O TaxID=3241166 RepID=UPI00388E1360
MRLLAKLFASLLIVLVVTLATFLTVLSTNFGLPMVKQAVRLLTPYELSATSLEYSLLAPFTLALSDPQLTHNSEPHKHRTVHFMSLRLSPLASLSGEITLRSVVVRGLEMDESVKSSLPSSLSIDHLALDDVTYHSDTISFAHADIQISDWHNSHSRWGSWQGKFQLSAPKIMVDGQILTNLLLDSEYRDDAWEIWGLSLSSPFGSVTGSATLQPDNQWVIHQLTLSDTRIEPSEPLQRLKTQWDTLSRNYSIHIKRLDLLDVSAALNDITVEHLNLSVQSVNLQNGELVWAQNAAASLLSFNASLFNVDQWLLTDLLAELSLSPTRINVSAFSSKVNDEGFVSFSGAMDTSSLKLNTLTANGLDIELNTATFDTLHQKWAAFNTVELGRLSIRHTNITLPDPSFPMQIIGLNLRGRDLIPRQNAQDGMWQGTLTASAAAASINRIPVTSPYANMRVDEVGDWHLDPLSVSFSQGQLSVKARIQLLNPSHPWTTEISGIRIPNSLYQRWLGVTLPLSGEHDVDIRLSGLGADDDSFAYSLSGDAVATLHQTEIETHPAQSLAQSLLALFVPLNRNSDSIQLPINVGKVMLSADRGRIKLAPVSVDARNGKALLSGSWDLVTKEGSLTNTSPR